MAQAIVASKGRTCDSRGLTLDRKALATWMDRVLGGAGGGVLGRALPESVHLPPMPPNGAAWTDDEAVRVRILWFLALCTHSLSFSFLRSSEDHICVLLNLRVVQAVLYRLCCSGCVVQVVLFRLCCSGCAFADVRRMLLNLTYYCGSVVICTLRRVLLM